MINVFGAQPAAPQNQGILSDRDHVSSLPVGFYGWKTYSLTFGVEPNSPEFWPM